MQLSAVLSHAFVASLDKSKLDLDDSERVLDLGTELETAPNKYLTINTRLRSIIIRVFQRLLSRPYW